MPSIDQVRLEAVAVGNKGAPRPGARRCQRTVVAGMAVASPLLWAPGMALGCWYQPWYQRDTTPGLGLDPGRHARSQYFRNNGPAAHTGEDEEVWRYQV